MILQGINTLREEVSDSASTDETNDGGNTHIDIPVINGKGQEIRDYLGNKKEPFGSFFPKSIVFVLLN